ncbi:uncharacterized protein F4812DRAFT_446604 [Daldinia caldariorum]|uniref:uncharacterized protein n=1 Tax=Daldinia caldariorum TaxID=326644 RepID=UPI0020079251|nr:uncharacterized protein F4812DRAFT_446604 [Daldinia caldariorum]KAI1463588.1 hypothetical protein F4812DRAFT_446604 [Daldinia caldariorum]
MATPAQPGEKDAPAERLQLSQREIEVLAKAFVCISDVKDGVPQVDAKKLAKLGPYASADSARHVWRPIHKKLQSYIESGSEESLFPATPSTRNRGTGTGTPGKRKADGDGTELTPTKKPRGRPPKAMAKKKRIEVDFGDEEDLADGEA